MFVRDVTDDPYRYPLIGIADQLHNASSQLLHENTGNRTAIEQKTIAVMQNLASNLGQFQEEIQHRLAEEFSHSANNRSTSKTISLIARDLQFISNNFAEDSPETAHTLL